MATPAKPRQSSIPGPGRASSIPTPGRSRSSSNVHQNIQTSEDISRAFADAIKANDPSMHRNVSLVNSTSTSSLSPQSVAYSGRRSVGGRPSSAASTSSAKIQERARTPSSARISSRPPSRSESTKPPRAFEVGDNVRIESLGFEGTLRYIGDIEGKLGLWAGIELSGGFTGKGKNNGSVGGKQYFRCPDKCGVFVATTKLSAPTVGPGAIQRPSSVASFKGGQITTAVNSGRVTPSFFSGSRTPSTSFSNGRITPSTGGRITPSNSSGRVTPSALAGISQQRLFKTPTSKTNGPSLSDKITAGSRASKYMTMTAQQLSTRDHQALDILAHRNSAIVGSSMVSSSISGSLSSPSRLSGSPFSTPRAGDIRPSNTGGGSPTLPSNRGRGSMNTPRARVPSGVAMPPPPSPRILQSNQSYIAMDHPSSPASHADVLLEEKNVSATPFLSSRPSSSTSFRSTGTDEIGMLEQLKSRLDAAEYENDRLRAAADAKTENLVSDQLEGLKKELKETIDNSTDLEGKLSTAQDLLVSQRNDLQVLQKDNEDLKRQLVNTTSQAQRDIAARESESQSVALEIKSLMEKIDEFEDLIVQKDELNTTQALNIEELSANVEKAYSDFQDERKELYVQIDELRVAGQETIALYEERLSVADSQRYELEHRILTLEANLKSMITDPASREPTSNVTSATLIDNETLRDQVQHLQKKSAKLEEQLEETRATLERDVTTYQEKFSRIRLEEEQHKRDLNFRTREVEQLIKSEASARSRIEEIEEAFRESTVALESTRGEVESLRTEMANLDILMDDASDADISSKLANFTKKIVADKARHRLEISQLEQNLSESLAEKDLLMQQISNNSSKSSDSLRETTDLLDIANDSLRKQVTELEAKVLVLTQELEERTIEIEAARKKSNRDVTLLNGISEGFNVASGKSEPSTEELAGLKHIVQELQKENLVSAQQIKLLESENRLLSTEAEQLRQEVHILEENLDSTLDEESLGSNRPKPPRPLADQRIRFETDLDQMGKRLSETEMKHARMIHSLNKEISELEALVEAKIYREDELEQEVERLKEKLSRQKKTSKNNLESSEGRHRLSTASISTTGTSEFGTSQEEVCEICERPGHDIFNCSLLKDDKKGVVCEDCERPGHVAADCPHSLDVF